MSIKSWKTVNYVVIAKYLHKNDDSVLVLVWIAQKIKEEFECERKKWNNGFLTRPGEQKKSFTRPLKSELDLQNIRVTALDRNYWQKIVKMVTNAAYSDIAL